jgi:hypothetical protein
MHTSTVLQDVLVRSTKGAQNDATILKMSIDIMNPRQIVMATSETVSRERGYNESVL